MNRGDKEVLTMSAGCLLATIALFAAGVFIIAAAIRWVAQVF